MRFRNALIVVNPNAGCGRGKGAADEVERGLTRLGIACHVAETKQRGDAIEFVRARERSVDLLVSVGGDGTLREVFAGLDGETPPVAVVPFGTANVLSRDLKLPRKAAAVLRLIQGGKTRALDVGTVNGALTFLVTGVGIDAYFVRAVDIARQRGPITIFAYVKVAGAALRDYEPPELEVELDGQRWSGPVGALWISNIVHYGGVFRLSPECVVDDGQFEVYLFPDGRKLAMLGAAARGFFASLPGNSAILRRARRVRVGSPTPVPYHVDGDPGGETPLEFEISAARRRIVVP